MTSEAKPIVGVIMGSKSDWETMRHADEMLSQFGVAHECQVVSAHRTPDWMREYATTAAERGLQVIIAGAGALLTCPVWSPPTRPCRCWACRWKAGP